MQKDHRDLPENDMNSQEHPVQSGPERISHGRIITVADEGQCLTADQLDQLERSFRAWAEEDPRTDLLLSRRRILLIFLLIRYTGAKLNEVLALDPFHDIDHDRQLIFFGTSSPGSNRALREVQISEALSDEIRDATKKYFIRLLVDK